jgi:nucleoside-diphosphate-sugar epimerase
VRIVLTGAAGHLGSVLLDALDGPHEVVPVDRDAVDHPRARALDVADLEAFAAACEGANALVHFAGEPAVETPWEQVLPSNLVGVYNAFEAARRAGIERVVFASSNHAVGGYELSHGAAAYRGAVLVDHRSQHWPDSLYGASKLWGEGVGRLYADRHGLRVLCLRIGACVPHDDWRGAAIRSKERQLHLHGDRERLERYAAMWLSERDLVQLVERGLTADYRYAIVYGVSANPTRFHDLEEARRVLGYVPKDAAVLDEGAA